LPTAKIEGSLLENLPAELGGFGSKSTDFPFDFSHFCPFFLLGRNPFSFLKRFLTWIVRFFHEAFNNG
jgi:hypothetical protein